MKSGNNYNDILWWVVKDKETGNSSFVYSESVVPDGTNDFPEKHSNENPDPRNFKGGTYTVVAGPVTMWEAGDILLDEMSGRKKKTNNPT